MFEIYTHISIKRRSARLAKVNNNYILLHQVKLYYLIDILKKLPPKLKYLYHISEIRLKNSNQTILIYY